jgi:predicted nucleic acid-binding protein
LTDKWLVDASVLLASVDLDDPHHEDARRLVNGDDELLTIDLAYSESTNVAVRAWGSARDAERLAEMIDAIESHAGLLRTDRRLVDRAIRIANEHGITVYDAAYVAGAEHADAPLVSCDVRDLVSRGLARLPKDARFSAEEA